ncbi:MAG: hypothetical protein OHK0048_03420 [Rhodoferax sp.]
MARVLHDDPRFDLRWVARRQADAASVQIQDATIPVLSTQRHDLDAWLDAHPVDALVDFSSAESLALYAPQVAARGLTLLSAVSAYPSEAQARFEALGQRARVMASPNITLGINFLLLSAKLLRSIAPFADVEIMEQHFRDKPEVSGTAKRIAESLGVTPDRITAMRLGGIVGHHEVLFGFPYQTVRLVHDAIGREAFGTGAAYALSLLVQQPPGNYRFDRLLQAQMLAALQSDTA